MSLGRLFIIFVLVLGGYQYWHSHRMRAPATPVVAALNREWDADGFRIVPLEKFDMEARVLGAEHYSFGREAQLAPVDLALGWGPMARKEIIDKVRISQSNRFYFWHVDEFPIPRRDIEVNSANMHMVPASREVERALKSVRPGQDVLSRGEYVQAYLNRSVKCETAVLRFDDMQKNGAARAPFIARAGVVPARL